MASNWKAGIVAAGVSIGVAGAASAQSAVQWRVEDGGNGHWYGTSPTRGTWTQVRTFAVQQGGDLATVTSEAESTFLCTGLMNDGPWSFEACWMGMSLQPDGLFTWLTGEAVSWTNWNPNAPHAPPYQKVWITGPRNPGGNNPCWWNDADPTPSIGHIYFGLIEWSADCNSDGIVDYGQIRAGELDDADANNVPDCCEDGSGCAPCASDVVEDGVVNAIDLASVLSYWGTDGGKLARSDVDGSGTVDALDLARVLSDWGPCP